MGNTPKREDVHSDRTDLVNCQRCYLLLVKKDISNLQTQWRMLLSYTRQPLVLICSNIPGGALTIIPACFANDGNLGVDPVGIQANHKTEQNGRSHITHIASVFRIDEIGLDPCWWL